MKKRFYPVQFVYKFQQNIQNHTSLIVEDCIQKYILVFYETNRFILNIYMFI